MVVCWTRSGSLRVTILGEGSLADLSMAASEGANPPWCRQFCLQITDLEQTPRREPTDRMGEQPEKFADIVQGFIPFIPG